MAKDKAIRQRSSGGNLTLNPCCRQCGGRTPLHLLNSQGVCQDCSVPDKALSLSRSVINRASLVSGWKKGEHRTGEL